MDPFLIQCAMLAAGLIASLFLFFSLRREVYKYMNRDRAEFEELRQKLEATQRASARTPSQPVRQLEAARSELPMPGHDPEESDRQQSLAPLVPSGFNLNRRVQAMRMLRRGEDVAHVAAALGVPRNEVELLVRVQEIAAKSGSWEGDPPPE